MPLVAVWNKLKPSLDHIRLLGDDTRRMQYLVAEGLWYPDLFTLVVNNYQDAVDGGYYPPATNPTDTRAPNRNFGATGTAANTLEYDATARSKTRYGSKGKASAQRPCHACGGTDHWKGDAACPKKDASGSSGSNKKPNPAYAPPGNG